CKGNAGLVVVRDPSRARHCTRYAPPLTFDGRRHLPAKTRSGTARRDGCGAPASSRTELTIVERMFDRGLDTRARSIYPRPRQWHGYASEPAANRARRRGLTTRPYDAGSAWRSRARSSLVQSTCGLIRRYGSFISRGARARTAAV